MDKNKSERDKNKNTENTINNLITYDDWFELNWQDDVKAIHELEKEREEIKSKSDVFEILEKKAQTENQKILELEDQKSKIEKETGAEDDRIKRNNNEIRTETQIAQNITPENKQKGYPIIQAELKTIPQNKTQIKEIENELKKTLVENEKTLTAKMISTTNKLTKAMQYYKSNFAEDALELSVEIESIPEYIEKLDEIISNDLPKHEATFKERLNQNTINDLFIFQNELEQSKKSITDKITQINKHLKNIEFNQGTYIEIVTDKNTDIRIKDFQLELRACLENITDLTDAYAERRFEKVQELLNKFRSNENKDIEWTKIVTDVRNWFNFGASEKYLEDDSEKEFYAGSTGKSGGQKEKLAYTIIASSLAYQFGLSYGEPKSKSFRFAVIDEAFGKGSDSSAEYGLELFKKLNLQLLIVTPLQKIQIIENYINAVHYVSNTEGNNSQISNLSVEEYKAEKQRQNESKK